jgi:hypothetical protein
VVRLVDHILVAFDIDLHRQQLDHHLAVEHILARLAGANPLQEPFETASLGIGADQDILEFGGQLVLSADRTAFAMLITQVTGVRSIELGVCDLRPIINSPRSAPCAI